MEEREGKENPVVVVVVVAVAVVVGFDQRPRKVEVTAIGIIPMESGDMVGELGR